MASLVERYADRLHGVLSCYDRMVMTGTLPQVCYAEGMTWFPYRPKGSYFRLPARFAEPLRDAIRIRAQELAQSAGIDLKSTNAGLRSAATPVSHVEHARGDAGLPIYLDPAFKRKHICLVARECEYRGTWL
jgi:hypothetical protein